MSHQLSSKLNSVCTHVGFCSKSNTVDSILYTLHFSFVLHLNMMIVSLVTQLHRHWSWLCAHQGTFKMINTLQNAVFSEYAQPLVSGVTTLGARSTFKPDEGPDPGYSDPDLYDAPISPDVYHAYAEPLPASGSEYATPIVVDMGCHPSGGTSLTQPAAVCGFMGAGPASLLTRTDSGQSGRSAYDTPKNATGQVTEDLTYQVPQSCTQKQTGQSWRVGMPMAWLRPSLLSTTRGPNNTEGLLMAEGAWTCEPWSRGLEWTLP